MGRYYESSDKVKGNNNADVSEQVRGVEFGSIDELSAERGCLSERWAGTRSRQVLGVVPRIISRGTDGCFSIDYGCLSPLIIQRAKQQQGTIEHQSRRIGHLEQQLAQSGAVLRQVLPQRNRSPNDNQDLAVIYREE